MSNKPKLVECVTTGTNLPENIAAEIDALAKTLPHDCQYQTKAYVADAINVEPHERAEVSILTTDNKDKMDEVVIPAGLELESYRKSGVVLWNHDKSKPIARNVWIKLHTDNTIRAKTMYPEKPSDYQGDWFTDHVWSLTVTNLLKAKSIGFLPLEPKTAPTNEELQSRPDWTGAGIYHKALLVEYSACSVAINDDALVQCIVSKSVDALTCKAIGLEYLIPKEEVKVEIVAAAIEDWVIKAEKDDCVSKKIRWMYDNGEDKGRSREQIAAIAYATCKEGKKKSKSADELIAEIFNKVEFNQERIVAKVKALLKNKGRV
jgi:hypothetical protein